MISVIIPAFNGARFLDSALASVRAQEFADLEILLMDDGSEEKLCPPDGVRYFRLEHRGQSAARNRGVRESRGDLLAFLDIDDFWTPGHLKRLHATFEAHPETDIVQGRMRQLQGERISDPYRMPYLGSCLFRKRVFEICGEFDETMSLGEDQDLMYRCWENDIVKVHLEDVSLIYRRHGNNMSRGKNLQSHVMIIKRRLDRIRAGLLNPEEKRRFEFREYIGETKGAAQWSDWSAS